MRLLDALAHRNFRLFFAGQAVSLVGDMVFHVALAWQAFELTGDASGMGAVLSAYMGAQVALLLAGGVLVDRTSRRALLVASDVAQGALALALGLLAASGALTLPLLVLLGALFGAAQAVANPALTAFVPETVPAEHLPSAYALHHGTRTTANLAGPALGGFVIAWQGTHVAFLFDAATFAASALLLAMARGLPRREPRAHGAGRDLVDGARYVTTIPWLLIAIVLYSLVNVAEAGPRNVVLPVFIGTDLGGDARALGLVTSVAALGGLLAALVVGSLPPLRHRGAVAYGITLAGGVALAATAFAPGIAALLVISFFRGAFLSGFGVLYETAFAQSVRDDMRGRVASLDMLGSFVLLPFSMAATAWFADTYGARAAFLVGGALMMALAGVGMGWRKARSF